MYNFVNMVKYRKCWKLRKCSEGVWITAFYTKPLTQTKLPSSALSIVHKETTTTHIKRLKKPERIFQKNYRRYRRSIDISAHIALSKFTATLQRVSVFSRQKSNYTFPRLTEILRLLEITEQTFSYIYEVRTRAHFISHSAYTMRITIC